MINGIASPLIASPPTMNWTADNNGAYDYAADTRGYSIGMLVEYHDRNWAFRFAEMLMPKVANSIDLQWNLPKAHADNITSWRARRRCRRSPAIRSARP